MCQFTIATAKCAPLIFSCCLRVSTKLLFIIADYFHVMLCIIISLKKPSKLSKILVYNNGLGKQFKIKLTSLFKFQVSWDLRKQVGVIAYPM